MTSVRRREASAIHEGSWESRALRYSCWCCVSRRPGKKSRAMISDCGVLVLCWWIVAMEVGIRTNASV